jgi:hypothetical protein
MYCAGRPAMRLATSGADNPAQLISSRQLKVMGSAPPMCNLETLFDATRRQQRRMKRQ